MHKQCIYQSFTDFSYLMGFISRNEESVSRELLALLFNKAINFVSDNRRMPWINNYLKKNWSHLSVVREHLGIGSVEFPDSIKSKEGRLAYIPVYLAFQQRVSFGKSDVDPIQLAKETIDLFASQTKSIRRGDLHYNSLPPIEILSLFEHFLTWAEKYFGRKAERYLADAVSDTTHTLMRWDVYNPITEKLYPFTVEFTQHAKGNRLPVNISFAVAAPKVETISYKIGNNESWDPAKKPETPEPQIVYVEPVSREGYYAAQRELELRAHAARWRAFIADKFSTCNKGLRKAMQ